MSKLVKGLITDAYKQQFDGMTDALLVNIRGVTSNDTNRLRSGLAKHEIRVMMVKNSLAKKAFAGGDLEPLGDLFDGSCAVVYGSDSAVNLAREILDWVKELEGLEVRGAVMEGTVFGPDDIKTLSKYPTKEEAQAQVVSLFMAGHQGVIGAATSAGANIASILKTIEEKLENGEAIAKIA